MERVYMKKIIKNNNKYDNFLLTKEQIKERKRVKREYLIYKLFYKTNNSYLDFVNKYY